ncbi:ERAD-associated protein [Rhizophlyctis rosea]|nr:ERAD-associated protein [Rhizophlyctis rosea]
MSQLAALAYFARGHELFLNEKNARTAFVYFARAARLGYPLAIAVVGFFFEFGISFRAADFPTAERYYKQAAERGSGLAQARMAFLKTHGRPGIKIDHALAEVYRNKCAKLGLQAVAWLQKAADAGIPSAQFCLGLCYYNGIAVTENDSEAFRWCEKAANAGHPGAQNVLGNLYIEGSGCTTNATIGLQWYIKAAEQREAAAIYNIGTLFERGLAVTEDASAAFNWYTRAARWGSFNAQNVLGIFYEQGVGVDQDPRLAVEHYTIAAGNGHPHAQYNLGRCYHDGFGTHRDDAKAVEWFGRAAHQKHALSQLSLGVCYEMGIGTEENWDLAKKNYTRAAANGCEEAKRRMRVVAALELVTPSRVLLGTKLKLAPPQSAKNVFGPDGMAGGKMELELGRREGPPRRVGLHTMPVEILEYILSFLQSSFLITPKQLRQLLNYAADRSTLTRSASSSLKRSDSNSTITDETDHSCTINSTARRDFLASLGIPDFKIDCECMKAEDRVPGDNAGEMAMEVDDFDENATVADADEDRTEVDEDEVMEMGSDGEAPVEEEEGEGEQEEDVDGEQDMELDDSETEHYVYEQESRPMTPSNGMFDYIDFSTASSSSSSAAQTPYASSSSSPLGTLATPTPIPSIVIHRPSTLFPPYARTQEEIQAIIRARFPALSAETEMQAAAALMIAMSKRGIAEAPFGLQQGGVVRRRRCRQIKHVIMALERPDAEEDA